MGYKDNIEYRYLIQDSNIDKGMLDEIVSLMLESVCTRRKVIRIAGDDYNGGLHCGECFDVFAGGKWKPTRIEMSTGQEWYLVGIKTDVLDGLRVRVHNR